VIGFVQVDSGASTCWGLVDDSMSIASTELI
jgi:hypothetical protein